MDDVGIMTRLDQNELARLANLIVFEQPLDLCASVMGVSEKELGEIIETDEFKQVKSGVLKREIEKQELLKDGWDSIEAAAINHVFDLVNSETCDPDFALKAAMVASRAQRRQLPERVLHQPVHGAIVLKLDVNFVRQVNANQEITAKHYDFLPAADVEKHLLDGSDGNGLQKLESFAEKWS